MCGCSSSDDFAIRTQLASSTSMSNPHDIACMCRENEAASLGLDTSKQTEDALSVHAPLAVAAWKGKGSINILVSKGMT